MSEDKDHDEMYDEGEDDEDELIDYDYYNTGDNDGEIDAACDIRNRDPEYFEYECLQVADVERLLNESVEIICKQFGVEPSIAKVLLHTNEWNHWKMIDHFGDDPSRLFHEAKVKAYRNSPDRLNCPSTSIPMLTSPVAASSSSVALSSPSSSRLYMKNSRNHVVCNICLQSQSMDSCASLSCGHLFCNDCWSVHLEIKVNDGITIKIQCMAQGCRIIVPEDFALNRLKKSTSREKYQQFSFDDYVKSHPELRFCPGPNCNVIVRAMEVTRQQAKRVICKNCSSQFCFKCGANYHSPTDCMTIKKWLTKCADDSETANYISANTKDCPKCHICIEKNGGCNHMQCYSCKHDFCWMCLGDWKQHGSEYYECSRYKENPNIANESVHVQAREALKKYLFYYERWDNHSRSLRLEEQTLERIKERINEKVMSQNGTWIDWQYLLDSANLLAKCRYSLQYTYPYAYYMEPGPRKQLFEYQQAQLEAEIENLSWKVERAENTDRGDLENQMDIAEKRRITLLKDFLTY